MAAVRVLRCTAPLLLPANKGSGTMTLVRQYRPISSRIFCTGGRVVLLASLPALSYLGYRVCRRACPEAVVYALDKAEEVLERADYLYSCGETEKLYQLLAQHQNSDNAEFLWRLARATRDLATFRDIAAEDKKRLTYEAFDYAKAALDRNEACFAAHKWYAVCLSDVGDYEGIKVKIGNSYIIKEHLERAIELNPKDATSIHILGYWCFAFAELPWYQRKIAATLFASPPNATYEEALEYFLKAEEVDPNFYSKNLLMLGRTYLMLKDKEKAGLWLSRARDYPAHTEEDKQVGSRPVRPQETRFRILRNAGKQNIHLTCHYVRSDLMLRRFITKAREAGMLFTLFSSLQVHKEASDLLKKLQG